MATPASTTFEHVIDVLSGAAPAPHTKFVSLRGPLTPQQVDHLASVIETSSLQGGLRLAGCVLGDTGARVIAKALAYNTKLETLELPGNEIGPQGARMLLACLAHNTLLTTLDLEDNPCWREATGTMEELDAAINRNRNLADSTCSGTPTPGRVSAPTPTSHNKPSLLLPTLRAANGSARHALHTSGKENLMNATTGGATNSFSADGLSPLLQRLQQLERRQFDDTNNSASLQTELVRIADWMQKNNGASEQVADVLGALQREQDDHRATLQELGTFQGQLVIVGQKLADKLVSMRHDWGGLREDIAHLQTAMTEGSTRIREEADASAQDAAQQVRLDCKGALDEVWENVEALEAAHTTLASRVEGVEDDLKHVGVDLRSVHEHTDKLDTYVNDMLKEMLGALNQSQEHLKWDVQQLTATVQKLQDKLQQDRAVDDPKGRRQPALPCTSGHNPLKVMEDIARRLNKLESATTQATKSVEAECVRSEQTLAITRSLPAQQNTCQDEADAHATLQQQVQQPYLPCRPN